MISGEFGLQELSPSRSSSGLAKHAASLDEKTGWQFTRIVYQPAHTAPHQPQVQPSSPVKHAMNLGERHNQIGPRTKWDSGGQTSGCHQGQSLDPLRLLQCKMGSDQTSGGETNQINFIQTELANQSLHGIQQKRHIDAISFQIRFTETWKVRCQKAEIGQKLGSVLPGTPGRVRRTAMQEQHREPDSRFPVMEPSAPPAEPLLTPTRQIRSPSPLNPFQSELMIIRMRAGLFFSFWAYPLASVGLLMASRWLEPGKPRWTFLLWFLLGLIAWTFMEYTIHRFIFHWRPPNRKLRKFIAQLHMVHHGDTHDPEEILVRPQFSLPVSGLIFGFLYWATDVSTASGLLVGIWSGFLYYEAVHYRVHLSKKSNGILQLQRRMHFIHHFIDERSCFGVTSPFWDILLGSFRRLGEKNDG